MSLPKYLYQTYKAVRDCELVKTHNVTPTSLQEFEDLMNRSQPSKMLVDGTENKDYDRDVANHNFVRYSLFRGNEENFVRYVSNAQNQVNGLILWTGNRHIVRFFGLKGLVHLKWDKVQNKYVVTKFESGKSRKPKTNEDKSDNRTKRDETTYENKKDRKSKYNKKKTSENRNDNKDRASSENRNTKSEDRASREDRTKSEDDEKNQAEASYAEVANRPRSDFNDTKED